MTPASLDLTQHLPVKCLPRSDDGFDGVCRLVDTSVLECASLPGGWLLQSWSLTSLARSVFCMPATTGTDSVDICGHLKHCVACLAAMASTHESCLCTCVCISYCVGRNLASLSCWGLFLCSTAPQSALADRLTVCCAALHSSLLVPMGPRAEDDRCHVIPPRSEPPHASCHG